MKVIGTNEKNYRIVVGVKNDRNWKYDIMS